MNIIISFPFCCTGEYGIPGGFVDMFRIHIYSYYHFWFIRSIFAKAIYEIYEIIDQTF